MSIRRRVLAATLVCAFTVAAPAIAIAAVDPYPNGCVSCHVVDKAKGVDHRLSVALAKWTSGKVDAGLLAKAKASAPAGLTSEGQASFRGRFARGYAVGLPRLPRRRLEKGTALLATDSPGAFDRWREQRLRDDVQERLHELSQAQHADRGMVDAERP